jgi:hypothetical protein
VERLFDLLPIGFEVQDPLGYVEAMSLWRFMKGSNGRAHLKHKVVPRKRYTPWDKVTACISLRISFLQKSHFVMVMEEGLRSGFET